MEQSTNAEKRTEKKVDWGQKLTSRKLWVTLIGVIVGIAAAFGLTENEYGQVAGVVGTVVSGIVYIVTEGRIDAARVAGEVPVTINIADTPEAEQK